MKRHRSLASLLPLALAAGCSPQPKPAAAPAEPAAPKPWVPKPQVPGHVQYGPSGAPMVPGLPTIPPETPLPDEAFRHFAPMPPPIPDPSN